MERHKELKSALGEKHLALLLKEVEDGKIKKSEMFNELQDKPNSELCKSKNNRTYEVSYKLSFVSQPLHGSALFEIFQLLLCHCPSLQSFLIS